MTDSRSPTVTVTQYGQLRIVAVRGPLPVDAGNLAPQLDDATEGASELILDLGGLRIDADTDTGVLLRAVRSSRRSGAAVAIACDHGGTLRRLASSGFHQVVPIADDVAGAQRLVDRIQRNQP